MNTQALKAAQKKFLAEYPGGFEHPEMLKLGKKHKLEQISAFCKESFAKDRFGAPAQIVDDMARLVGRSTMVSMFEKPKFRDMTKAMSKREIEALSEALNQQLHGPEKAGFEAMTAALEPHNLAKWTIVTVVPAYYRPQKDVFIKPTTAKLIIAKLGVDLEYGAKPTWPFYRDYRKAIKELKAKAHKSLTPNNPAFSGFLMMSLK